MNEDFSLPADKENLLEVHDLLKRKSDGLLRLLENPNLQEHEAFTDLIMSIIHVRDEFLFRQDLTTLPASDLSHLANDMKRIYGILVPQWIDPINYLRENDPYLFHLSMRTNPFDPNSSAIVK